MNKCGVTDDQILAAALALAEHLGAASVTREAVAERARVSPALVSVRFGTMTQFKRDLMRYAIRQKCLTVIAQGIVAKDRHALKAPLELRLAAIKSLTV